MQSEKEATLEVKKEKERQIEYTHRQISKFKKTADRLHKQTRAMLKIACEFNTEFKVKSHAFKEQDIG